MFFLAWYSLFMGKKTKARNVSFVPTKDDWFHHWFVSEVPFHSAHLWSRQNLWPGKSCRNLFVNSWAPSQSAGRGPLQADPVRGPCTSVTPSSACPFPNLWHKPREQTRGCAMSLFSYLFLRQLLLTVLSSSEPSPGRAPTLLSAFFWWKELPGVSAATPCFWGFQLPLHLRGPKLFLFLHQLPLPPGLRKWT